MKFTPNENILRVALIVFSILFGILSVSLIALGVVYINELSWPRRYIGLDFIELPTLLIILGSLSLAMALVGCVCAKTYSRTLLITFAVILFIILCFELSIAVIAFINFSEHEGIHTRTHQQMLQQYNSVNEETKLFFQDLEEHYNCCGVSGVEKDCTQNDTMSLSYKISENTTSTTSYNSSGVGSVLGCAEAVNEQIQLVAAEIGYFTSVLALLQVVEIGYVYLIQRSVKEYHAA